MRHLGRRLIPFLEMARCRSTIIALVVVFPVCVFGNAIVINGGRTGTYTITMGTTSFTFTGPVTTSTPLPTGAGFKISPFPPGVNLIKINSLVAGVEPKAKYTGPPFSNFTVGYLLIDPGETGFASLEFTGDNTATAFGGSTISVGIEGGFLASYTTIAGDTFQSIFSNLIASLDAHGVDAFQSGDSLMVISSLIPPDGTSLVGAVSFTATDDNLPFAVSVGTIVPETSTIVLFGICVSGLVGYGLATSKMQLRDSPKRRRDGFRLCRPKPERRDSVPVKSGPKTTELAQQMANHESARTTGLYDRRGDEISLDESRADCDLRATTFERNDRTRQLAVAPSSGQSEYGAWRLNLGYAVEVEPLPPRGRKWVGIPGVRLSLRSADVG